MTKNDDGKDFEPRSDDSEEAGSTLLPPLTRRAMVQTAGVAAAVLGTTAGSARAFAPAIEAKFAAARAAGHMGPHKIKDIETVWVTMGDGVKLALRIILPEDADKNPVPAILEYIPYRRRDGTRVMDEDHFNYLASSGYACVRPDIRGSGDSEGVLKDEYLQSEQDDGVTIIAWIAKQPWCTGKVGMMGISWGGFSALQVAANRPPELKAIITHCSTDDRYTDDAHYIGGAFVQDMFGWGSDFYTLQAFPPDPAIVGTRWRDMWKQRCDAIDFSVANWVEHQTYDAFWKHGSVCEDYSAIQCPVYAIGGWTDAYKNSIPRLMENLKVPRKALIGPWSHHYPHEGIPGPAIDYLDHALRWWDHWLKGVDTGIMEEPMYRAWMEDEVAHEGAMELPGRWVAEDTWPSPRIAPQTFYLNAGSLDSSAAAPTERVLVPLQSVGITAGHWCPFNMQTELPLDQQADDGRSLTFDTAPLSSRTEILGYSYVDLDLSVDKPGALVAVRLNEVEPGGTSRKVTYGVLNLTHRDSHEHPEPLVPGKRYRIRIQLNNCGYAFKPGNRIRVSLSTTYWPLVWPSPEPATLTLYTGTSTLMLPVRPPRPEDAQLKPFGAAFVPPDSGLTVVEPNITQTKTFDWDVGTSTLAVTSQNGGGVRRFDAIGTMISGGWKEVSHINDADPTSAQLNYVQWHEFMRGDWRARVETSIDVTCTKDTYILKGEVKTYDRGKPFFVRSWDRKIPRILS